MTQDKSKHRRRTSTVDAVIYGKMVAGDGAKLVERKVLAKDRLIKLVFSDGTVRYHQRDGGHYEG